MRLALFDFDGTISDEDSFRGFIIYYCGYSKFILGSIIEYNMSVTKNIDNVIVHKIKTLQITIG